MPCSWQQVEQRRIKGHHWILAIAAMLVAFTAHAAPPKFTTPTPIGISEGRLVPRLLGINLIQNGQTLMKNDPIQSKLPLEIEFHWLYKERATFPLDLVIRFSSHEMRVVRDLTTEIAPPDDNELVPGEVWQYRVTLDLSSIAHSMSGDVYMAIARKLPLVRSDQLDPLIAVPLTLEPLIRSASVAGDTITRTLGDNLAFIDVSFRLGHGAEWKSAPGDKIDAPVSSVGLFSAFSYGDVRQNREIGILEVTGAGGSSHRVSLRSGVHSARADYDYDPKSANHEKITVAESTDAGYNSVAGRPFERYKYVAAIELPTPVEPPVTIRIANTSHVMFDVYGIGLISKQ